jgi:tryptophan-rich sensory protein
MHTRIKSILLLLFILVLWLIGGFIFRYDSTYYSLLNIPTFALSPDAISTSWFILYILISISIFMMIMTINIFKNYDYLYVLITNYLANQLFPFMFFTLKSPFFGFIMTAITFISSIFLFIETKRINLRAALLLIPYIAFNIYALILSISVYIMNF